MASLQRLFLKAFGILLIITLQSCGSDDDTSTPANSFTDTRDGNVYRTVTIGDQVWMAENLKYIPGVIGPDVGSTTTPYYYVYNYDGNNLNDAKSMTNYSTYGVLYNWPAVMDGDASSDANPSGVQGICPDGWHVPSPEEWFALIDAVGGLGGNLKEAGTNHWTIPNVGATDNFGFTALPGGVKGENGFGSLGEVGGWWVSSQTSETNASFILLFNEFDDHIYLSNSKIRGQSLRCVKD